MKKSFIKVGFMFGLALITAVSLNSCSSEEEDASGDGTEQTDENADTENEDADKCEDGKDGEHKCEAGKCEEGKCQDGTDAEKPVGKGDTKMEVNTTVPEEKPVKKSVRGGDAPKVTTDGN
ncbi:MAG: hypothetical protein NXI10_06330 [bacterium]|nr:hypothetical protein [bacterium]